MSRCTGSAQRHGETIEGPQRTARGKQQTTSSNRGASGWSSAAPLCALCLCAEPQPAELRLERPGPDIGREATNELIERHDLLLVPRAAGPDRHSPRISLALPHD